MCFPRHSSSDLIYSAALAPCAATPGSSVEDPGVSTVGALQSHLIERGNETRLVPPARGAVRRGPDHRLRNLSGRKGRVGLL